MSKWWTKCVKLAEDAHSNSMVILDLCAQIQHHTKRLHEGCGVMSENKARNIHNQLASLREQLDQVLPRINAIARTARNIA